MVAVAVVLFGLLFIANNYRDTSESSHAQVTLNCPTRAAEGKSLNHYCRRPHGPFCSNSILKSGEFPLLFR